MWCAHTLRLMKPIATVAATITGYPKIALREKTGMISRAKRERRQHQNVDLRMPEDPEEVHPQHSRAASLRVEEMRAKIAIDRQHDLRRRQRTQRNEHQATGHQRSARRTAAWRNIFIPGQRMQIVVVTMFSAVPCFRCRHAECRQRPDSPCCVRGENLRGQRRIGEPAHIRRRAGAIQVHRPQIKLKYSSRPPKAPISRS